MSTAAAPELPPSSRGVPLERHWAEANQAYLVASLRALGTWLKPDATPTESAAAREGVRNARAAMSEPPALESLAELFGLSSFERAILLFCASVELAPDGAPASEPSVAAETRTKGVQVTSSAAGLAVVAAPTTHVFSGLRQHGPLQPTFNLALARLPEAHWSALSPERPLRKLRLISVGAGDSLVTSPLRIDERILHFLTGIACVDERVAPWMERVPCPVHLSPSHLALAAQLAGPAALGASHLSAVLELVGPDVDLQRALAAAACAERGLTLFACPAYALSALNPGDEESVLRLLGRELALQKAVWALETSDGDASEGSAGAGDGLPPIGRRWLERLAGQAFLLRRQRGASLRRHVLSFDVPRARPAEQRATFVAALGPVRVAETPALLPWVEQITAQFLAGAATAEAAVLAAESVASPDDAQVFGAALWDACRRQTRARLEGLAQYVDPRATWDDLVLPPAQKRALAELLARVRHRTRVYETWGFEQRSERGLGVSALFAGASGTGKTMAAEVLAHALKLDLFRVDLSQVVSKYIGETEKNLRRVFDAAEAGGAVLLFDEADALFGKRSEVKDSHDRYANVEISYLLQRMEMYRGLAILTTNQRAALDTAFLRRLAFVMDFPVPDAAQREEIWRRAFPRETPTENLDFALLARLSLAGGNIRNVALAGAFLAAEAGSGVRMKHIWQACEGEFRKLERPLPSELRPLFT